MKYFICNGYRPDPLPPILQADGYIESHVLTHRTDETIAQRKKLFKELGHTPPKFGENIFFRDPRYGKIAIYVYDVYRTFLLIATESQRKAYFIGNSLKAILSTLFGNAPTERNYRFLLELASKPEPEMDVFAIANLIQPLAEENKYENVGLANEILRGTGLGHFDLKKSCTILKNALEKPNLLYAIQLLDFSYSQVCGFMVGSYYDAHYSHDRREMSRYILDKSYLENRIAYDTAFLSAFRGIEALLDKPHFKKHEIKKLLFETDVKNRTSFTNKKYRSFHEVFSSRKRFWKYEDIISHYLKLRNAVAAHGNIDPPNIIMEDQVFEIQLLLKNMFTEILYPNSS